MSTSMPPSTVSDTPVMKFASSEARKRRVGDAPGRALLASKGHARISLTHDFVSRLVDGLMSSRISQWAASGSFGTRWLPGRAAGS